MDSDPPPGWHELLRCCALREVAPKSAAALDDPQAAIARVLEESGFVEFARSAAAEGRSVTLVVNDNHRFTDTHTFLGAVLQLLDRFLDAERRPPLRMLVAAGSHVAGADERAEHERSMLGGHRDRIAELLWHDARNDTELLAVGHTTLHRWMAEGGFYLACGSMEPHYFAGVTGGHKTLTVGVMSLESLTANHENALSPRARPLALDGNPVHLGIVDALADLEDSGARLLVVNEVLVDGKMVAVTAGHPLEALHHGLDTVRECFSACVEEPVDIVVARVLAPLDRDFYQAEKGIKNTEFALREEGVMILEATCRHGVGIDHFVALLRQAATHDEAVAVVEARGYRLGDHKAVRLRALTDERRVRVALVSEGVPAALGEVLGVHIFADRRGAAEWAAGILGPEPSRGLIVQDAGNVAIEVLEEPGVMGVR